MSNKEDDSPTVVIDFNSIKEALSGDELLTDEESELLLEKATAKKEKQASPKRVYLFDYQSDYFQNKVGELGLKESFIIIKSLEELNKALSNDPKCIVCFYYNAFPKIVNQLSAQIKLKFKRTKTIIIAKGLSPKKAQQHHNSKYGASAYLKDPFDHEQLIQTISSVED